MKRFILCTALLLGLIAPTRAEVTVVDAPQTDAVYRLPLKKGAVVSVERVSAVECGQAHNLNMIDFCAWRFTTNEPTEVFAAREGVVMKTTNDSVLILHDEGIYTEYLGVSNVKVAQGERVSRRTPIASARARGVGAPERGRWSVVMMTYHYRLNPNHGKIALNGAYEYLCQFINPIFTTKGKCKTLLDESRAYTVRTRTWCWPWE